MGELAIYANPRVPKPEFRSYEPMAPVAVPREARDLIFKIRSYSARSDLKNKVFSAVFCLFLRSDLAL